MESEKTYYKKYDFTHIYDINNKTGLGLSNEGITKITHEGLNTSYLLSLYKDLQLTNK
jgi:hypothetical protein